MVVSFFFAAGNALEEHSQQCQGYYSKQAHGRDKRDGTIGDRRDGTFAQDSTFHFRLALK